ncbi:MAG: hypothetical protein H7A46_17060 [Verrucomicrobiales bacterium]|nr:hypothetical protein [Verrucomicrobiales bacterium]
MTHLPKRHTRSAGVTFEVPVLDYLHEMALAQSRDRSFCINQIIREHAARNGQSLPPAVPPSDDGFSSGEA